jgi:hypothetical protein
MTTRRLNKTVKIFRPHRSPRPVRSLALGFSREERQKRINEAPPLNPGHGDLPLNRIKSAKSQMDRMFLANPRQFATIASLYIGGHVALLKFQNGFTAIKPKVGIPPPFLPHKTNSTLPPIFPFAVSPVIIL